MTFLLIPSALEKRFKGIRHGVGAMSLIVGLKGTKEELDLPVGQIWAFTHDDLDKGLDDYMCLNAEDAGKEDIPLLFITFPSAKDPSWPLRYPGKT